MMEANELEKRFTYHAPKPEYGQTERYKMIRAEGMDMALRIEHTCPDSREKSIAMTKLEEAVFWANAAIARNE